MSAPGRQFVFGPVPSRRLGRSLGVDLIPFKTCPYDCVYCQLGRTTEKTRVRRDLAPAGEVVRQVAMALERGPRPDWITMSGSGEPTLHAGLGTIIQAVRQASDVPVAVLTNGALLDDEDVREDLCLADLVIPSLDAGSADIFDRINRPADCVRFEVMAQGLADFRCVFRGQLWLEVFLVAGLNDADEEVARIAALARRAAPDRIQLNTVTRPPAESWARPVAEETLRRLARMFEPVAEVISHRTFAESAAAEARPPEGLLALIRRRPCTAEDAANGLGVHVIVAMKGLEQLCEAGLARKMEQGGKTYYAAARAEGEPAG
ncbi:MAG TPA: radical SAM protein [Candidatus Brocadiia bacterium]|nr:radical SAM protein [Candidatus Brocadiia bacterium]